MDVGGSPKRLPLGPVLPLSPPNLLRAALGEEELELVRLLVSRVQRETSTPRVTERWGNESPEAECKGRRLGVGDKGLRLQARPHHPLRGWQQVIYSI